MTTFKVGDLIETPAGARGRVTEVKTVYVVDNHGYEQEWDDNRDLRLAEHTCDEQPCTVTICGRT